MVIPLVTPSRFLFSDFLQQFTVNSNPHPAGSRRRFLLPEDISQVVQKSGGGEEQRSGRPVIHVVEKILGILIALSCCQRQPAASGIPILRHLLAKQIELAQCVLSELVSLLGRCHQPLERLLHILGEQLSLKKELTQPVLGKLIVQFCAPAQPPQSLTEILRYFTFDQKYQQMQAPFFRYSYRFICGSCPWLCSKRSARSGTVYSIFVLEVCRALSWPSSGSGPSSSR